MVLILRIDYRGIYCEKIYNYILRIVVFVIRRVFVYSDYKSAFNTLLEKDGSFSIHHRNIQSLAIEIYKFLHGLSPAIMGDIIKLNRPPTYNLRTRQELYSRNPKTMRYGTETISFLGPKIWAIVPQNIKNCTFLSSFKINIRKWKPDCSCRLCKCFLKHVGFI